MVQNLRLKMAFIFLVLIGACFALIKFDITLGLDLEGGSSMTFKLPIPLEEPNPDQIVEQTIEIFRKRIDSFGLKEIPIRSQTGNEILIELPGMTEAEADNILDIIQSQGELQWMLVAETESDQVDPSISLNIEDKNKELVEFLKKKEAEEGGWDINTNLDSLKFNLEINGKKADYMWYPYSDDNLTGKGIALLDKKTTFKELGLDEEADPDQYTKLIKPYFELIKRYEDKKWQFSGQDLEGVNASFDRNQFLAVGFEFYPERGSDFGDFTKTHEKKQLAIILDGKLHSAPSIEGEISGRGQITGGGQGFSSDEQKRLITILKSGSVVVKPVLLSRSTIGPTLGENSISRGKIACISGMSIIFVFLIIYYMLAGIVSAISLMINLALLMTVLVMLGATLTLPGIAGIVLTVGMAVDANILIFERIREEKDKGKTIAQSIKNGFERAFVTIVDANVTTFITGFILANFGTGPIKGFASTLMIGIVTSLFSALFISKVIFAFFLEKGAIKKDLRMLRLLTKPNINFLSLMKGAAFCSIILIVAGLACFFSVGQDKYGLDFTGGYNLQLKCTAGTTQAQVQKDLGDVFTNVQVVSIKKDAQTADAEPFETFDIKIKSTVSDKEAIEAETKRLEAAAENSTTPVVGDSKDDGSAEFYKSRIKELLKNSIVHDPIYDLTLTPDVDNKALNIKFSLNLAETCNKEAINAALKNILTINKITYDDDNKTASISALYSKGIDTTATRMQGRIYREIKLATANGANIKLLDPFPMSTFIGPTVGHRLRDQVIIAIFFSLVAIIVYIRLRFREFKYGIAAAAALIHDVMITLGVVTAARMAGIVDAEIDLPLIAAFLTIIGYSLNDTIVVFDRVRENLPRIDMPFDKLMNLSINQTLSRTILTSLTTLVTLVILFVLNYGQRNVMEGFSFAMIVGVIVGTYSSIFVASPVLIKLHKREQAITTKK